MKKDKYYFIKILFIFVLVSLSLLLFKKIQKKYEQFFQQANDNSDNEVDEDRPALRLSIENKNNMFFTLRWNKIENVEKFFIIMYKNHDGPFIIDTNISRN